MRFVNFGSLNLDFVYSVPHIVLPGETIASVRMERFCGGKGLNQSIALACAGGTVYHAGFVGEDGGVLLEQLEKYGVHTRHILTVEAPTGNAIIQVEQSGQNSIVLFGGANHSNTPEYTDAVLNQFGKGDVLLLQNEINGVDRIIDKAHERGMKICLNPSPFHTDILGWNLSKVDLFLINEIEGAQLTGAQTPDDILDIMQTRYPKAAVALTLGGNGSVLLYEGELLRHGIYPVEPVDTTAAGDTFTGFLLAGLYARGSAQEALQLASKAAAIAVSKKGASDSIPSIQQVLAADLGAPKAFAPGAV